MSAEKLLEDPSFFSGGEYNIDEIALEYLDLCKKYDTDLFFAPQNETEWELFKYLQ